MAKDLTFLFLPGAWHYASCWDAVREILHEKGFKTSAIDLPLNNPTELSNNAFQRDVEAIQTWLHTLVEIQGRDVVLVMHSYSGCCGSEALKDIFYQKEPRRRVGDEGGVVALVYCTAFLLPAGMAGLEYVMGINNANTAGTNMVIEMKDGLSYVKNPRETFYHDFAPEVAEQAIAQMVPCDANAFSTNKVNYSAYKDYPTTYIVCENDRSLMPATQRWSINRVKEDGIVIKIMSLNAGHMAMLEDPAAVAKCLENVASNLGSPLNK